jgi:carbonic anhydrase/acetyltransferase-like protein (isoleucine patch superfamily)
VALYALGDREPDVDPTAYVHPMAVLIGSVTIGPESSVWPSAVLRGDHGEIRIGARTSIQDGTVIHTTPPFPTIVGDDCVIGHLVHLEGCTIEDFALVGSGSVVLHRAIVRTNAVVGAGAVVPGGMEVPTGAQALGVPATIKPDSVRPGMISQGRDAYVHNASWYAKVLRRID